MGSDETEPGASAEGAGEDWPDGLPRRATDEWWDERERDGFAETAYVGECQDADPFARLFVVTRGQRSFYRCTHRPPHETPA